MPEVTMLMQHQIRDLGGGATIKQIPELVNISAPNLTIVVVKENAKDI